MMQGKIVTRAYNDSTNIDTAALTAGDVVVLAEPLDFSGQSKILGIVTQSATLPISSDIGVAFSSGDIYRVANFYSFTFDKATADLQLVL